jgi:hypothetical protein
MSLRDWFAGQVMDGALERAAKATENEYRAALGKDISGATREQLAAALAYQMADAMILRRERLNRNR